MIKIPQNTAALLNTLENAGFEAYIVGGCVRDSLLGKTPFDFDVTTNARPEEVEALFEHTVPTGIKHGTVTVLMDRTPIEVTTFRSEGEYKDSRHPESIEFVGSLSDDLSRRDFTVNALCYNQKTGVVDLFGGLNDLENKLLRAVGNPEKRFREDALRILRLFRFSSQLGFAIEGETLTAALDLREKLQKISKERIFAELQKAVGGENPQALAQLINGGGLSFLGIEKAPDFNAVRAIKNPQTKLFAFLQEASQSPLDTLKILKASNKQIKFTEALLKILQLPIESKTELKQALKITDYATVACLLEYLNAKGKNTARQESLLREIEDRNEPFYISHLAVTGQDLKALGYSGGEIKAKLCELLDLVIEHPEKNKKDILLSLT